MYMSPDDPNDKLAQVVSEGILRMLQQAKDRFNSEGRCLPQAYILKPDGTTCHCEGAAEDFDAECFAERLDRQVADVHGVGVMSFGETWMVDEWDGVDRVSEAPDRFEALVATMEADGDAWLYVWPIHRDKSGTPRVEEMRPPVPCDSGLFRLRSFPTRSSP